MEPFIEKYRYNYIKKRLFEVNTAVTSCLDKNTVEASKAHNQERIYSLFPQLEPDQKEILRLEKITNSSDVEQYLKRLEPFVTGMTFPSDETALKVFRKEKKIRIPDSYAKELKRVYLGWIDGGTNKLFIIYNLNGKPAGMACRLPQTRNRSTNICSLCNHIGKDDEVAFVSPVCKTAHLGPDAYKSIGFYVCLDSEHCNDRITSVERLEELLRQVNNIK
ncbi:MAG TPA: elongation factor G-binding protein [Clostridiaceae bacterium]|nr:elongation factor G-binding protein [Clostridiaceae bacterium]